MKTFTAMINYDNGNYDEYELEAVSEDDAYDKVYMSIGYDPGEVFIEENDYAD